MQSAFTAKDLCAHHMPCAAGYSEGANSCPLMNFPDILIHKVLQAFMLYM